MPGTEKGGHLCIVELTTPVSFPMKQLFSIYSNTVLPMYGKLISKDQSAYSYLNKTIEAFPQGEVMMEVFKRQDSQRQSSSDSPSASAHSISQPNKTKYYGQVWTHRLPSGAFVLKNYFNEKFENEGIDAQYINFEIPSIEILPRFSTQIQN